MSACTFNIADYRRRPVGETSKLEPRSRRDSRRILVLSSQRQRLAGAIEKVTTITPRQRENPRAGDALLRASFRTNVLRFEETFPAQVFSIGVARLSAEMNRDVDPENPPPAA